MDGFEAITGNSNRFAPVTDSAAAAVVASSTGAGAENFSTFRAWNLGAQVRPLCLVTGFVGNHCPKRTELNLTVEAATTHFKLNASASSHRTEARADDRAGDLRDRPNTTMNRSATTA
ncbi:hypothetical protein [Bradyrhizobium sp. 1]|uniref:hypothetical protein n=1 Tax=Bradyrhizobium sp. 1 TaxID=241591 RepID=UPI001FF81431|nr:hypothetical protein [Bradyrhizobium sp. 1]MCK1391921.1 hypothetical protein [Bradyrhizobium sp. 1]